LLAAPVVGADVIMMRVVNGTGEAIDSYSNGYALPVADTVSNVVLLSASESNGVSTISIRYCQWSPAVQCCAMTSVL
jgi:hypothetical protein